MAVHTGVAFLQGRDDIVMKWHCYLVEFGFALASCENRGLGGNDTKRVLFLIEALTSSWDQHHYPDSLAS